MTLSSSKKALLITFYMSVLLMMIKFVAYLYTSSNAVLFDALESIANVMTASFSFYSIYLAGLPKDENHPYGHGKIEYFVYFLEGIFILLVSIGLIAKSIYNFFYPHPITHLDVGIFLMFLTVVVNLILGYSLLRKSKKEKIITLHAEGKHLVLDGLVTVGVIVGLFIIYFTNLFIIDSVISLLFGLFVATQGYRFLKKSISGLMDETDFRIVEELGAILSKNKPQQWIDIHNLRVLSHGSVFHIDCHVTLPFYLSLEEAHQEVKNIEQLINQNYPYTIDLFIHTDPCIPICCKHCSVSNCAHRSEQFTRELAWTRKRLLSNQKFSDTSSGQNTKETL